VHDLIQLATNDCRHASTVAHIYRLTSCAVDDSITNDVISNTWKSPRSQKVSLIKKFMLDALQDKFYASPTDSNILVVICEIFILCDHIPLRVLHEIMLTIYYMQKSEEFLGALICDTPLTHHMST
jgi:hypothetical protein